MNKEILEITKKFHDTYEKLASEYAYKTREDTKVFDINSNNGKLMYATVNEIVSPILKENKKQKEAINKTIEYIRNHQLVFKYATLKETEDWFNQFYIYLLDILKEVK